MEQENISNPPTRCTCNEGGAELDICPFSEEVYDDPAECMCCPYCRYQCAMDI